MKSNHTLNLWDYSVNPAKAIIPGQVLTIAGTECAFVGISPDSSAYFWLYPGECRFMTNEQLGFFKMAVLSCFEIKSKLLALRKD